MANIFKSSIGKKLIMSISGLFLIVFLLLHGTINLFSVIDAFNGNWGLDEGLFSKGCAFMATPIVTIMVPVLALGFVIHILYAGYLTYGNIQSRGGYRRYEVSSKAKAESWASQNMFALGVVVLGFIALHLTHFWDDMQLKEFMGQHPEDEYFLLEQTFGSIWMVILYIVWFAAIWFHLTHGFWSALHTIGLNNSIWQKRLECIGNIFATLIFVIFTVVAIVAHLVATGVIA